MYAVCCVNHVRRTYIDECAFDKNRYFAWTNRLSKKLREIIIAAVNNNMLLGVAHFVWISSVRLSGWCMIKA